MARKKKSTNVDFGFVISRFLAWRVILLFFLLLSVRILPLQEEFLGGGLRLYMKTPWVWAWGNFDGEHYLSIARDGYSSLRYFFFPLYPFLIKLFAFGGRALHSYFSSGLFVSHTSFLFALAGLWKLFSLDLKKEQIRRTLLLLFLFPTSFYFVSLYTESLFLALVVWSFVFARDKKWLLAGLLGGLATSTRIVGLALLPALAVEVWQDYRKTGRASAKAILGLLFVPLGILLYMYFLQVRVGDPLAFYHSLNEVFGEQRSSSLVLLPQVFYRYIFKILPNLNYSYLPSVFTGWLEFLTGFVFLGLSVISFWKTRLSYAVFLLIGYLIPTFSGSFSSLPRYALVLFPAFMLLATFIENLPKVVRGSIYALLFVSLGVATGLFARGYWVS